MAPPKHPLLIVNTGNGKGKTTAAVGLTVRAVGNGQRAAFIQFIKGSKRPGEVRFLSELEGVDLFIFGHGMITKSSNIEEEVKTAREGWEKARALIAEKKYDLIVLDELTYLVKYNVLTERQVLDAIAPARSRTTFVITGRGASRELIDAADLVTEMKNVKHPFASGIKAQQGIEF
jgi:cob(I)alamin adenosyltransferase